MPSLYLNNKQREHLLHLRERSPNDVIELCKSAFEYLTNGPNTQRYELLAKRYNSDVAAVRDMVEVLISLIIEATKSNAGELEIRSLQRETGLEEEVIDILAQFVTSKRNFIEGSIKTANIRDYRLVNLEWRLDARIASRSLLQQNNIFITIKFYLHTEPKSENRDLLESEGNDENGCQIIHPDERRNRKDLLVQTDISSLRYMIQSLEDALFESRSRRIRNIVDAIH